MSLWKREWTPDQINTRMAETTAGLLSIAITRIEADALHATMPVDTRHVQPFGLLHGGVSVVLSETIGSVACMMTLDEAHRAVGIEINANHMAGVKQGDSVTAICRPMHTGARTQVWQTEIRRGDGKLACVSRLTCAVIDA